MVSRKDTLSVFFALLCVWSYIQYREKRSAWRYFLALFFFSLGMLSKFMVASLPCVLLLLDYWPLRRLRLNDTTAMAHCSTNAPERLSRLVVEKIPLACVSLLGLAMTVHALSRGRQLVTTDAVSLAARGANALLAYVDYLRAFVWPTNLAVYYPFAKDVPPWQAASAAVALVAATACVVLQARKRPYLFVGWIWFVGCMTPASGLVQGGDWPARADRFFYMPGVGLAMLASWGLFEVTGRLRSPRAARNVAAACIVLALALVSLQQVAYWRDSVTLFARATDAVPGNAFALSKYAGLLANQGSMEAAVPHFRELLRLAPDDADSHRRLGVCLSDLGKADEALAEMRTALRLAPGDAEVHNSLAMHWDKHSRFDLARQEYAIALSLEPRNANIRGNLALSMMAQGQLGAARQQVIEALRIAPNHPAARQILKLIEARIAGANATS